jgi:autotransporter-associated beta strand protein
LTVSDAGNFSCNTLDLVRAALYPGSQGTVNLNGGTLAVNNVITDNNNAGTTNGAEKATFNFNGGTLKATTSQGAFLEGLTTAKVQANGAKIDDGGFAITIAQPLLADSTSPGGGLTKLGAGTLRLSGTNSYTGSTIVSNGVLQISGAIGTGAVNVASSGTLSGSGMVGGAVNIAPGGTLSPGDGVGTFTVSNNVTVNGNLFFELNKSLSPALSNDFVLVTGTLTNAGTGTLTVSNLGPALVAGDTFTLFSQPLVNGGALTIIPPVGVTFTNKLAVNGSIQVLSTNSIAAYSTNITSSVSGSTLTLSWPATHLGWILQSQTNDLSIGLGTNWQDIAGTASVTSMNLTIMPTTSAAFYRLRHP